MRGVQHKDSIWWVAASYLHSPLNADSSSAYGGWVVLADGLWVCPIVADLVTHTVTFIECRRLECGEDIQSERDYMLQARDREVLGWRGVRPVTPRSYWQALNMACSQYWEIYERDVGTQTSKDGDYI